MNRVPVAPPLEAVLGTAAAVAAGRISGTGPSGQLPLTREMLIDAPSGDVFGLTQNVGMGWSPAALGGPEYVIISTMGGIRGEDGRQPLLETRPVHHTVGPGEDQVDGRWYAASRGPAGSGWTHERPAAPIGS